MDFKLRYFAILFLFLVSSIADSNQNSWNGQQLVKQKWRYEKLNEYANLKSYEITQSDKVLVKVFMELYKIKGHELKFNELLFDKVLVDEKQQVRFFLFHINYISDIQAVFKVDAKNNLIDNFLRSSF